MEATVKFLRYADLVKSGIINNRPTLSRWIATEGFPPGRLLGPNSRAWTEDEILKWAEGRPIATGRDGV